MIDLINWPWLEDLLIRGCEGEIRAFARRQGTEPVFAFCLEFDGLAGDLSLSYGTRSSVDRAAGRSGVPAYYRSLELRPENWSLRRQPITDPDGFWAQAEIVLARVREAYNGDLSPEAAEFLWLRFEYLAECVVQALKESGAFQVLAREPEFVAFAANEDESLEELEDRLVKLYPRYRRATVELINQPRPRSILEAHLGTFEAPRCATPRCLAVYGVDELYRCTHCQSWFCDDCAGEHLHPELFERVPLFGES